MRPHEPQSTIVQTLDLVMHPVPWELLRRLRSPAQEGTFRELQLRSSSRVYAAVRAVLPPSLTRFLRGGFLFLCHNSCSNPFNALTTGGYVVALQPRERKPYVEPLGEHQAIVAVAIIFVGLGIVVQHNVRDPPPFMQDTPVIDNPFAITLTYREALSLERRQPMTTRAARNQKAYRERRKIVRKQQVELVTEVLDGIADGTNGITCTTSTDLWGINFHWRGEQAAYDVVEKRANDLGFTLGTIFNELEQRAVKRYQDQVNSKQDK